MLRVERRAGYSDVSVALRSRFTSRLLMDRYSSSVRSPSRFNSRIDTSNSWSPSAGSSSPANHDRIRMINQTITRIATTRPNNSHAERFSSFHHREFSIWSIPPLCRVVRGQFVDRNRLSLLELASRSARNVSGIPRSSAALPPSTLAFLQWLQARIGRIDTLLPRSRHGDVVASGAAQP